jgi:hypothetical protein
LLLNFFKKSGYFSTENKIDTSGIENFRSEYLEQTRTEAPPPPYVITHEHYKELLINGVSELVKQASKEFTLVFVVFASKKLGGKGVGSWQCKGNLFAYFLCLYYQIPSFMNKGLVIINSDVTNINNGFHLLPPFYDNVKKPVFVLQHFRWCLFRD